MPPTTPVRAAEASLPSVGGVAVHTNGTVFISSVGSVFRLDQQGILTRVAGTGRAGYSRDGGRATDAQVIAGGGLAIDRGGNLYIADGTRIRRVSSTGIITTVAGPGAPPGDGLTSRWINGAGSLALDAQGNLYFTETSSNIVRKLSSAGLVSIAAGNTSAGFSGDGGPATSAQLNFPMGIHVDNTGNLYIADTLNGRVRKVSPTGVITTVAGKGTSGSNGDGGPALNAALSPSGVALDSAGNLYIAGNSTIRKVSAAGIITTWAGSSSSGFSGDGGPASAALMRGASNLAFDTAGNLFVSDRENLRLRKISASGIITTVAGNGLANYSGDGGPANMAQLGFPAGIALDAAGNLYISDPVNSRVRKISNAGVVTLVAGTGTFGYSGDGGPATSAQLHIPQGMDVDANGNLFIADKFNNRIRKVSTTGTITTVAGNGQNGSAGDGGPAIGARLQWPADVKVDALGNLYISELSRIRKVTPAGIISTLAGDDVRGTSGDGGPAIRARVDSPSGVAIDTAGNVYFSENSYRVRRISPAGIINTVAGDSGGPLNDGGPATRAGIAYPRGLAVDTAGNLFIADTVYNNIRRVPPAGIITTIAGNGTLGYSGDGGPAANAELGGLYGLAIDRKGSLLFPDGFSGAVRVLQPVAITSVTNAASNLSGPIAAGEIVVITGNGLGPSKLVVATPNSAGVYETQLAGTSVLFNGAPAPVIYASSRQVAAIVPYSISLGGAQIQAGVSGRLSEPVSLSVSSSAPGVFTLDSTGRGQAAAVNQDGTLNGAANRARAGEIILLYATGEGQTTPRGIDGKTVTVPLPRPVSPVTVAIGGQLAQVLYAGGTPGQVAGLMQLNVRIPEDLQTRGAVPVSIQVGSAASQAGVFVWIR